jgi:hypothetical protein
MPPIPEGDLDWPVEAVELSGVTELRVHGVGGTPPAAMLDDPDVRQVTGDRIAGMWRGSDRQTAAGVRWHREAYSWGGLTSRALASALWLTLVPFALVNLAGWMALGRPRRPGQRMDWRVGYQQALVRVVALAATWTYVLLTAQMAMDLGAWQCTQVDSCRLRDWPGGVFPLARQLTGHPARAVVLAALVPLAVIAALNWLSVLSRRRYESYGSDPQLAGPQPADRASLFSPYFWRSLKPLRSHWLHVLSSVVVVAMLLVAVAAEGGQRTAEVRATAVAGVVTLGLAVALAGWHSGRRWLLNGPVRVVLAALLCVGLFAVAAVLAWQQPLLTPADRTRAAPGIMPGILEAFNVLIVGVYAVALLHALVALSGRFAARGGGRSAHRQGVARRPRLPVVPGPFTAMTLGVWLLFAVWAGFLIWVARWLSSRAVAQDGATVDRLVYPLAYEVLAQLTATAIVVIAALVLVLLGLRYAVLWLSSRWRGFPTLRPEIRYWAGSSLSGGVRAARPVRRPGRWPRRRPRRRPARWLGMVRDRKWLGGVARWLEWTLGFAALAAAAGAIWYSLRYGLRWLGWNRLLWTVGAVGLICVGLTVLAFLGSLSRPVPPRARRTAPQWIGLLAGLAALAAAVVVAAGWLRPTIAAFDTRPPPQGLPGWLSGNSGVASTLLTAIPLGAVLLVRQSLRSPNTRRIVGIAWDVATFWPRAFHPLAPPSYAERAVPELETRVRTVLASGGAALLAGHSQGAVVCTATLAQLTDLPVDQRRRLSVITYGNPTGHLYMRWFPHYVYPELVEGARRVPSEGTGVQAGLRWVNFFRHTDYIGRTLFAVDGRGPQPPATTVGRWYEDVWLPDPPTYWYRRGDGLPVVRGHAHNGYERQSAFARHAESEIDRL